MAEGPQCGMPSQFSLVCQLERSRSDTLLRSRTGINSPAGPVFCLSGLLPTYFCSRIDGVNVTPTSSPSGEMNRLTVWPHGSFLFLTSIRCPRDSRPAVVFSTFSTSNSSHACGTGMLSGQESVPKQECAACERGHSAKCFAP